jgi:hypothetical protein
MSEPTESAAPEKKNERKTNRPSVGVVFSALGLLLAELLLPILIAGALVWYLFSAYNVWARERTLALVLYGIAVVVLALILSVVADSLLAGLRGMYAQKGARFSNNASLRMMKMATGGLVLPIVLVVIANLVSLPNSTTVMNLLIAAANRPAALTPPAEVGQIAASTKNPATRHHAIQVLQNFRSTEALTQLIQIAERDSDSLSDAGTRAALIQAVASYGLTAKAPLLALFNGVDPTLGEKPLGTNSGVYERYFSGSFESLQADSILENPDPADQEARKAKILAAQAALKKALTDLEENAPAYQSGDPRLDFVIQAFLAMEIGADKDILAFAKATAADQRFSGQVRGDALLLIAKTGDKNDLNGLFPYLKDSDELVQARTLQAIASLQDKINHTVGK